MHEGLARGLCTRALHPHGGLARRLALRRGCSGDTACGAGARGLCLHTRASFLHEGLHVQVPGSHKGPGTVSVHPGSAHTWAMHEGREGCTGTGHKRQSPHGGTWRPPWVRGGHRGGHRGHRDGEASDEATREPRRPPGGHGGHWGGAEDTGVARRPLGVPGGHQGDAEATGMARLVARPPPPSPFFPLSPLFSPSRSSWSRRW